MSSSSNDRFREPKTFPTGVQWNPTDPKPLDQTPYLTYLDKEEEKVRAYQTHHIRWPWCERSDAHEHTDTLRGTFVDGKPAGPIWDLQLTS